MGGKKKVKRKVAVKMEALKQATKGQIAEGGKLDMSQENVDVIIDGMSATLRAQGYAPVVIIGMNKEGKMANITAPMVSSKDAIALLTDALKYEMDKVKVVPMAKGGNS